MLSNWMKKNWKLLVSLLLNLVLLVCLMQNCQGVNPEPNVKYIPVHDTITVEKERIIEKTKPIFVTDTFIKVDSVYVGNDGTWVELPMKWSQYKDTIKNDSSETQIDIKYHGIEAGIDEINLTHNYFEKQTTIVKEPKKVGIVWFVGAYAGYGVHGSINTGTFGHGPEVGIGVGIGIGNRIK